MTTRKGPPVHPNKFAWKPNQGVKINETEVGGKFRPLSEVTGVCPRCKDQIEWKRKYGKYKPLSEPAKWSQSLSLSLSICIYSTMFEKGSSSSLPQSLHGMMNRVACAKEQKVCAKCSCRVGQIIGRDSAEVEAEQKMLEEAIKNARERDRRTLLRSMNKGKSHSSTTAKSPTNDGGKAGELFAAESLEEYAEFSRDTEYDGDSEDQIQVRN
ncbi:hypothetical protein RHMOL_Rhmol08G0086200 [Rhododendron molle]|uniref:Uncharacterized protein n=1 Tax=Rhododendron molle TaxID=49168 RepID=A0ACC0MMD9_RHOML|nr:hypothetical protein RHMOL_Rhmol08G0086200 [Rhododendron molle]